MSFDAMDIAGSALTAERLRMDVIASNIANINTTRNHLGQLEPYKRKLVVFKTILEQTEQGDQMVNGVTVDNITEDQAPMRVVYDPTHPDANSDGFVAYPNVSVETEMIDMISAKAAYQANITTIQTFKTMYGSALDI